MLEADNRVIRIANNDRIPTGMATSLLLHPQVIDVVQIDVRQFSGATSGTHSESRLSVSVWQTVV